MNYTIIQIYHVCFHVPDGRLSLSILYTKPNMPNEKQLDTVTVNQEITGESEALEEASAAPGTFFSLEDVQCAEDPDSETSPMSKVSGRVSEDSTV